MHFDWWAFAFQGINVLVLMWLLSRFLFRPVARIIADRQEATSQALAEAEKAKQAAVVAEAAAKTEQDKTASARLEVLEAARKEAEQQKKDILDAAHKTAADIRRAARDDAAHHAETERKARAARASELAVAITRRLLANLPDDARVSGYAARLRAALEALDSEQRQALNADADHLRLVTPRPLDAAELAEAMAAIRATLDTTGAVPVDPDAALIAGLELRGRHGVIHNSLSHDLERIAEALVRDDRI
ncbi:F0F1 ATP synthase subunit B family protein [Oceanibium sediminis]|uniref:F0F1 ATP synthase subunit B family protein n=1 Tax=Oceanibium sediminis TaxID=2026339 RepID=UPI000DD3AC35|nr:F0F1 ATP synthase subunit B [Oceanibium sediminis]